LSSDDPLDHDEHDHHDHGDHEGHDHGHEPAGVSDEQHRALAVGLFNDVWELLGTPDRTRELDGQMLHAAHASRFHWGMVGGPQQWAVGEWQCSRVYAVLGRGEPALHHARESLLICEETGLGDWVLAAAYEALARASGVAGDASGQASWLAKARQAVLAIADAEDREVIEADLATLEA
jgi:hypothetical protein